MDPTQRIRLGRTDLEVTRLGLGTAPLGGLFDEVSDEAAAATVERAHALGWRLFDTAPLYGYGLAEQRTGRALSTKPRDGFVLSTKVGRLLVSAEVDTQLGPGEAIFLGAPPLVPRFDFSADGVMRSLRESIERLGIDRVDVVYIHDPDDHHEPALREALPALVQLRTEGVISAVGAGMNQTQMLCEFAKEGDFDCFLVAGRYTLLDRSAEQDLLPLCEQRGIGVVCGGVFNSGVLAAGETYDYAPASSQIVSRVRHLEAVCDRYGVPLKAAAIQFPLTHPAVTCVVVGARSREEVDENDAMFSWAIPDQLWRDLEGSP